MIQRPLQRILVFPLTAENFVSAFQKSVTHSVNFRPRIGLFHPSLYPVCCVYKCSCSRSERKQRMLKFKHLSKCIRVSAINQAQRNQILPHEGGLLLWVRLTGEDCGYRMYFQQHKVYSVPSNALFKPVK